MANRVKVLELDEFSPWRHEPESALIAILDDPSLVQGDTSVAVKEVGEDDEPEYNCSWQYLDRDGKLRSWKRS